MHKRNTNCAKRATELKRLFHKQILEAHPDKGGRNDIAASLIHDYKQVLESLGRSEQNLGKDQRHTFPKGFKEKAIPQVKEEKTLVVCPQCGYETQHVTYLIQELIIECWGCGLALDLLADDEK